MHRRPRESGEALLAGLRAGAWAGLVYAAVETASLFLVPWLGAHGFGPVLAWTGPYRAMAILSPAFTVAAFVTYVVLGAVLSGSVAAFVAHRAGEHGLVRVSGAGFWISLATLEIVFVFGLHGLLQREAPACWGAVVAGLLAIVSLHANLRSPSSASRATVDTWVILVVLVGVSVLSEPGTATRGVWRALFVFLFVAAAVATGRSILRLTRDETGSRLVFARHRRAISLGGWFLVLGGLALMTSAGQAQPPYIPAAALGSADAAAPNVILITLDSVRWDHVSLSGYGRQTTPNLQRLAEEATVYTNAISSSNTTLATHASLFTGLTPSRHGAHTDAATQLGLPMSPRATTLAQLLSSRGYRTVGIAANIAFLGPEFGFARGFSHYRLQRMAQPYSRTVPYLLRQSLRDAAVAVLRPPRAEDVFANAVSVNGVAFDYLAWAAKKREKYFLFLNYMDAHAPYLPPAPFDARFPGRDLRFQWDRYGRLISEVQGRKRQISTIERSHLESQYDGGIAYLDSELGALFAQLRRLGLYDQSLIIVTSDHGEAFGEQSIVGHGTSLFQHQLHVPLIVKYPASHVRASVDALASSTDILPTVLDVVGAPIPAGLDGISLRSAPGNQARWVSAESFNADVAGRVAPNGMPTEIALFRGEMKLVRDAATGSTQVFNLRSDRSEAADLGAGITIPPEWNERFAMVTVGRAPARKPAVVDAETRERLRSLGYIR